MPNNSNRYIKKTTLFSNFETKRKTTWLKILGTVEDSDWSALFVRRIRRKWLILSNSPTQRMKDKKKEGRPDGYLKNNYLSIESWTKNLKVRSVFTDLFLSLCVLDSSEDKRWEVTNWFICICIWNKENILRKKRKTASRRMSTRDHQMLGRRIDWNIKAWRWRKSYRNILRLQNRQYWIDQRRATGWGWESQGLVNTFTECRAHWGCNKKNFRRDSESFENDHQAKIPLKKREMKLSEDFDTSSMVVRNAPVAPVKESQICFDDSRWMMKRSRPCPSPYNIWKWNTKRVRGFSKRKHRR